MLECIFYYFWIGLEKQNFKKKIRSGDPSGLEATVLTVVLRMSPLQGFRVNTAETKAVSRNYDTHIFLKSFHIKAAHKHFCLFHNHSQYNNK